MSHFRFNILSLFWRAIWKFICTLINLSQKFIQFTICGLIKNDFWLMRFVFFWRSTAHLNHPSKFKSWRRIWYLRRGILLKQLDSKTLFLLWGVKFICIDVFLLIKITSFLWSKILRRGFLTLNRIKVFNLYFLLWFYFQLIFKFVWKSISGIILHFFCVSFKIFSKCKSSRKFNVFLYSKSKAIWKFIKIGFRIMQFELCI